MTARILLLLLFLSGFCVQLQAQQTTFSKVLYNANEDIRANAFTRNENGDVIIVGNVYKKNGIVVKVDNEFNSEWSFEYIINEENYFFTSETFTDVIYSNNQEIIVIGNFYDSESGRHGGICLSLNSNSDLIWTKTVLNEEYDLMLNSVTQTKDNGFIIVGEYYSYQLNEQYICLLKLNSDGEQIWTNFFKSGESSISIVEIQELMDNSLLIGGNYYLDDYNAFLINISDNGNFNWAKSFKDNEENTFTQLNSFLLKNNQCLLSLNSHSGLVLLNLDLNGDILWSRFYNPSYHLFEYYPKATATKGNSFVIPYSIYASHGSGIMKVDSLGNPIFSRELFLYTKDIFETENRELLIIGNGPIQGEKFKGPKDEIGIIQIDSLATLQNCVYASQISSTIGDIYSDNIQFSSNMFEIEHSVQIELKPFDISTREGCVGFVGAIDESISDNLFEIFPNPNNGRFEIHGTKRIENISIYDLTGKCLYNQFDILKSDVKVSLDFMPGIYLINIECVDKTTQTRKILITE